MDFINYMKRINSMSPDRLLEEGNRLIARVQAFDDKEKLIKLACQTRSKSIPKNATIMNEYVKCRKPNCHRSRHGPYYYAYWKDAETKKLKKRYIGRNYFPNDGSEKAGEKE